MFKRFFNTYEKAFMSHINKNVIKRCALAHPIDLDEYKKFIGNSYERKYIEPYLSNEAFISKLEMCLKNTSVKIGSYDIPGDYNEYILTDGIQELLKRYKKLTENA